MNNFRLFDKISLSTILSIITLYESLENIKHELPAEIRHILSSSNVLEVIKVLRMHYDDINNAENLIDLNNINGVVAVSLEPVKM